ncbi:hypothetical protein C8R46DRAFT_1341812 [Mycena filopes]|nr:hypothetical protein C8R46DRAFT_1341812 [Mycena filopes]
MVEPEDVYRHLALVGGGGPRHLRLLCTDNYEPANGRILHHVAMPFLESAELDFQFRYPPTVPVDFTSAVLALAPPTLAEICVTFSMWPSTQLPPATVTAVDKLLAAAFQRPRMRWRVNVGDSPDAMNSLHDFGNSVREGMSFLASTGRLVVERYFLKRMSSVVGLFESRLNLNLS